MIRTFALPLLLGLAFLPRAAAQSTDYFSQVPFLQRVLTGTDSQSNFSAGYQEFVSTTIPVPAGFTVLLSATFTAESRCVESGADTGNWCSMQILIDGEEAFPQATQVELDFAFDSTDRGNNSSGSFESHSFSRHRCYTNSTSITQQVPVVVEWGVTNLSGGGSPSFWIDDWTLVIQESQNCFEVTESTLTGSLGPQFETPEKFEVREPRSGAPSMLLISPITLGSSLSHSGPLDLSQSVIASPLGHRKNAQQRGELRELELLLDVDPSLELLQYRIRQIVQDGTESERAMLSNSLEMLLTNHR